MSVALAGRAPASFEIKSANLPLLSLLLKSPDLALLADELRQRYADIPDFFDHDPLVLDLTPLQALPDAQPDLAQLLALLRPYRVVPVAVRGGSAAQMQAALQVGLAAAPDARVLAQAPAPSGAAAAPAPAPEPVPAGALVIDKPLRSGQQVYARGRDLVLTAMVNPGAEVIADGHIHVYAPLRGKAIAGARGNTDARILSLCLEAELLSIAGVYRTSEVPLPGTVHARAAQVRLDGGSQGKLVIEALERPASPASGRGRN